MRKVRRLTHRLGMSAAMVCFWSSVGMASVYQMPHECAVKQTFNNSLADGRHTGTDCGVNNKQGVDIYPIGDGTIRHKIPDYEGYGDVMVYQLTGTNWCVLHAHQNLGYTDAAGTYRVKRYPEWYNFNVNDTVHKTGVIGVVGNTAGKNAGQLHGHIAVYQCDMPLPYPVDNNRVRIGTSTLPLPFGYLHEDNGTHVSPGGNLAPANSIRFYCDPLTFIRTGGATCSQTGTTDLANLSWANTSPAAVAEQFAYLDWVKTTDYLNMRTQPGIGAPLIRELPAYTMLYIWNAIPVEKDGYSWWQVLDPTNTVAPFGWVSGHRLVRYALWIAPINDLAPHYAAVDTGEKLTLASNHTLLLEALCSECGGIGGGSLAVTTPPVTTTPTVTTPPSSGGQNPFYVGLVQDFEHGEDHDQFLARVARMRRALGYNEHSDVAPSLSATFSPWGNSVQGTLGGAMTSPMDGCPEDYTIVTRSGLVDVVDIVAKTGGASFSITTKFPGLMGGTIYCDAHQSLLYLATAIQGLGTHVLEVYSLDIATKSATYLYYIGAGGVNGGGFHHFPGPTVALGGSTLYVADFSESREFMVYAVSLDGSSVKRVSGISCSPYAFGMAATAEGTVFMSCGNGSKVTIVDSKGVLPSRDIGVGTIGYAVGLATDKQGRLYVADHTRSEVLVFRISDGQYLGAIGTGMLSYVAQIAIDVKGNILVEDSDAKKVFVFLPDSLITPVVSAVVQPTASQALTISAPTVLNHTSVQGPAGTRPTPINDCSGDYAIVTRSGFVDVIAKSTGTTSFSLTPHFPNLMGEAMYCDAVKSLLYVATAMSGLGTHVLEVYSLDFPGKKATYLYYIGAGGVNGAGFYHFPGPTVAVGGSTLYVADLTSGGFVVYAVSLDGSSVTRVPGVSCDPYAFAIAGTVDGKALLSCGRGSKVSIFDAKGVLPSRDIGLGTIAYAAGLAADTQGRLYVADYNRKEVLVFRLFDGQYLGAIGTGMLSHVEDIAVDSRGNLVVADPDTGTVWVFEVR